MKFNSLFAAAALAVASLGQSALAAPITMPNGYMGVLTASPSQFGNVGSTGTFADTYYFALGAGGEVKGSLAEFFGTVTFSSVALFPNLLIDTTPDSFSFSGLTAGVYALAVSGSWGAPGGFDAYTGSVYQPYCPPVPEPETYAMALAGLCAAGFVMRRRSAA